MPLHCVIPLAALVPGIRGHHSNGRAPTLYPPHFAIPLSEHLSIKKRQREIWRSAFVYASEKREREREREREKARKRRRKRWERDATSREAIESVVASVGSLSGPTTISSMYMYMYSKVLSLKRGVVNGVKQGGEFLFFRSLSERVSHLAVASLAAVSTDTPQRTVKSR